MGGDGHQTVGFRSVVPIEDCYLSTTVTPKNTELAPAAPGTPTAPSALPVTPLARSGSASGYPHAMSGRTAVSSTPVSCACGSGRRLCALPAQATTGGPRGGRRAGPGGGRRPPRRGDGAGAAPMGTPTVTGSGCRGIAQSSLRRDVGIQPAHESHRGWDSHGRTRNSPAHGTAWLPPALGNTNGLPYCSIRTCTA